MFEQSDGKVEGMLLYTTIDGKYTCVIKPIVDMRDGKISFACDTINGKLTSVGDRDLNDLIEAIENRNFILD